MTADERRAGSWSRLAAGSTSAIPAALPIRDSASIDIAFTNVIFS
jgi:hypothetical protein